MSVSRRFLGRRAIAAVAAVSLLATGSVVATPTAIAQPIGGDTVNNPNKQESGDGEANVMDTIAGKIFPGNTITLTLEKFAPRTAGQTLIFKIDGGKVNIPAEIEGTSFDKVMERGTQRFGLVTAADHLPNAEGKATITLRLPDNIEVGPHTINILGGNPKLGGGPKVSVSADFVVSERGKRDKPGVYFYRPDAPNIEYTAQGGKVDARITNLPPNAEITFVGAEGGANIKPAGDIKVNANGNLILTNLTIPADARLGAGLAVTYKTADGQEDTVTARRNGVTPMDTEKNASAIIVDKAVSTPPGLYQSAYSAQEKALFVTRAPFNLDEVSQLMKVNPDTLEIEANYDAATRNEAGQVDDNSRIFGIAIDEANGKIWATRTLGASVSVYDLKTGELVKRFDDNDSGLSHPRDVVVSKDGKVYVGDVTSRSEETVGKDTIKVYDAKTLSPAGTISIPAMPKGPLEIRLDEDTRTLYTVDFTGKMVAKVELDKDNAVTMIDLENENVQGDRGAGIALDTKRQRLYVASQAPSHVKVIDLKTNKVIKTIITGASPLDALYDAKNDVVWTINRLGATANVIDPETMEVVATRKLDKGYYPNQLSTDGMGHVFVTTKPTRDLGDQDMLFKLSYAKKVDTPAKDDSVSSKVDSSKATSSSKKNTSDNASGTNAEQKDFLKKLTSSDKKDSDKSSKTGTIIAAIAAILALLGGFGYAVTNGLISIPGFKLPMPAPFPFPAP